MGKQQVSRREAAMRYQHGTPSIDTTQLAAHIERAHKRWPARELHCAIALLQSEPLVQTRDMIERIRELVIRVHERRRARDLYSILNQIDALLTS